ncbi:hypothetical protein COK09_27670 [Bacillus cereus]|uniref:hypothetical protein n=1 Tax=Bacillus cereus group TaxID=86661 RepID=UPI000BF48476|nr:MULTISPECIES: hypothetical protein [Bacillus cereus group]PFN60075.1 hypothetical protein COJ59_30300 [Bacillus cereus]PFP51386.1 hypothetical protein COK09_27670 [Bacillus cereus]PFY93016.1 hypothetical protein COL57_26470 [Bacillus wiedmannii]PGZ13566.1 hypothetical protein COE43_21085 [Bacillus cereus]
MVNLLTMQVLELPLHEQLLIKRTMERTLQKDIGERLGIAQNQVSDIEHGKITIPKECRAELIRYLYQEGK